MELTTTVELGLVNGPLITTARWTLDDTTRAVLRSLNLLLAAGLVVMGLHSYAGHSAGIIAGDTPAAGREAVLTGWTGRYPLLHGVVDTGATRYHGSGATLSAEMGDYSAWDQTIYRSSLIATEPLPEQRQLLRHEYGHALLADLVNRDAGHGPTGYAWSFQRGNRVQSLTAEATDSEVRSVLPSEVQPIFDAYRRAPRDVYGEPDAVSGTRAPVGYYNGCFGEFFAQSYARYLTQQGIDPEVKAAFDAIQRLN